VSERVSDLLDIIMQLLSYAAYPECICQKTVGCECGVEEAERNYFPTIERAEAALSRARRKGAT
jgi:hypothetical protein